MAENCAFCEISPVRIIAENSVALVTPSFWPATSYHLLVIPKRHVETELELTREEEDAVAFLRKTIVSRMRDRMGISQYNFGVNVGAAAGQTQPHLHYHIIFRSTGDVADPRGGIRNMIPGKGRPEGRSMREEEAATIELAASLRSILSSPPSRGTKADTNSGADNSAGADLGPSPTDDHQQVDTSQR